MILISWNLIAHVSILTTNNSLGIVYLVYLKNNDGTHFFDVPITEK